MPLHGLPLTDAARAIVAAGAPSVPLGDFPDASGIEPGRPVRLIDRQSETVASGVADPDNDLVRIFARRDVRAFDDAFFRAALTPALALRRSAGLVPDGRSAFRLVNAEGDGLSGLTVDLYGAFAVICAPSRGLLPYARQLAAATIALLRDGPGAVRGIVLKVRGKDPQDRSAKEETIGERPPEKLVVEELGVPFEVHLLGALNTGLFTDMREHRRGLARFVTDRDVLNTFAYTGAISVAAARAGARSVTSVDLSSGVLAWAKENFHLSGFDPADARYRFEVSDVRRFFERAADEGRRFHTIILDPPTVSAARASQWSMKKDYADLLALATKLLPEDGGVLWASANTRRGPSILQHVEAALKKASRRGTVMELGGLPPDYPTPPAFAEGRYLEVCQLFVS